MRTGHYMLIAAAGLSLAACAKNEVPVAAAAPLPAGAVAGSTAADRDGDGVIDGYYTADGIYHANAAPAPAYAPPPPAPTRVGERG